jgi:hypothetical protein
MEWFLLSLYWFRESRCHSLAAMLILARRRGCRQGACRSKVLIDATKPPLNAPEARSQFERIRPPGIDRIRPQDFLA